MAHAGREKNPICDFSSSNRMPLTDQIIEISICFARISRILHIYKIYRYVENMHIILFSKYGSDPHKKNGSGFEKHTFFLSSYSMRNSYY